MGHLLRFRLSNEIVQLYAHYQNKYQHEINSLLDPEGDDCEKNSILTNRIVNICKVIIKLKDSSYKDKIIKECKEYFYDKKFIDKLDSQKHLIGFENGIYDLNHNIFRDGIPDDYVTLSTGLTLPVYSKPCTIQEIVDQSKMIDNYEEIHEGLIDFDDTSFGWKNYADFKLSNTLIYTKNGELFLDGTSQINLSNYKEI